MTYRPLGPQCRLVPISQVIVSVKVCVYVFYMIDRYAELEHYSSLPFSPAVDSSHCDVIVDKPAILIKLHASMSVCLSVSLYVSLSVCLSVCLSLCLAVTSSLINQPYLSSFMPVCISVCLSLCLSVCLCLTVTVGIFPLVLHVNQNGRGLGRTN